MLQKDSVSRLKQVCVIEAEDRVLVCKALTHHFTSRPQRSPQSTIRMMFRIFLQVSLSFAMNNKYYYNYASTVCRACSTIMSMRSFPWSRNNSRRLQNSKHDYCLQKLFHYIEARSGKIKKDCERRTIKIKLFFILKVSPWGFLHRVAISLLVHTRFVLDCERVVPKLNSNHNSQLLQTQAHI